MGQKNGVITPDSAEHGGTSAVATFPNYGDCDGAQRAGRRQRDRQICNALICHGGMGQLVINSNPSWPINMCRFLARGGG